ncbi:type II secretion system minor pseudopilin GspI [Brevundimonas variabilis]|uniref:Type II secretion system protein I n=1 Tax=Brevundimonas variabilis TaxID=74312 RepID=A0A7W9CKP0_9CAUL|nr:type II secretion system minor pseudopilin GspI [Brevundimonas variabilis]MBB5747186.1 general secretion pathway protein I [Brevundimonas variabilis]
MSQRDGYSLMEAMVALFILAVATVGLTRATQTHIDGVRGLEQRVIAQWVAENRLVELNLEGAAAQPARSTVRMMDRDWAVDVATRATDDPDLLAVDVAVAEAGTTGATVRLSGFVDRLAGAST